jgi:toxin-antitoxin system PIN domain toxin
MPAAKRGHTAAAPAVTLLDGNVLVALVDEAHVHHGQARSWFSQLQGSFATCPITQGTLLRLLLRVSGQDATQAMAVLTALTRHHRHVFWTDALPYGQIEWRGILGHRQVTDAYLAALARHHGGRLASFDRGLVALHPDVAVAVAGGAAPSA